MLTTKQYLEEIQKSLWLLDWSWDGSFSDWLRRPNPGAR